MYKFRILYIQIKRNTLRVRSHDNNVGKYFFMDSSLCGTHVRKFRLVPSPEKNRTKAEPKVKRDNSIWAIRPNDKRTELNVKVNLLCKRTVYDGK